MKNRILGFFLVAIVLFSMNSTIAYACDEQQTNTHLAQLLFGVNAARWKYNEKYLMLEKALYLCSEQADGLGQDKLDYLKNHKVSGLPSLSSINVTSDQLLECSHNSWKHAVAEAEEKQNGRREILINTVDSVFGSTFLESILGTNKAKYSNFAALLYYMHILFDYMADDVIEHTIVIKGNTIPAFAGVREVEINGNVPQFTIQEKRKPDSFPDYSNRDYLGRSGVAFIKLSSEMMPKTETKAKDSQTFAQMEYPDIISTKQLYNRCHLIAHQLAGNDTAENLITGTRYMNDTMTKYENKVAQYIKNKQNHVLYKATPVYYANNILATGVQLEAYSIEDNGKLQFNVFCYNVQPGIHINYLNGESEVADKLYNARDVLPFAIEGANDAKPDLIFEIDRLLKTLFDEEDRRMGYSIFREQFTAIALEARNNSYYQNRNPQNYIREKEIQHKYFQTLKACVPLLLEKESFFNAVFK